MGWTFRDVAKPGDLVLGQLGRLPFAPRFVLEEKHRPSHMYVIGLTGMGKSKFLLHCIYQDVVNGRGCGVIDPHSDLVDDLIELLNYRGFLERNDIREKIIHLDPSRTDRIIPFNVLKLSEGETSYELASSILEAFRRTWPESLREAPHFSNVMIASLITLIENKLTLTDIPRLLTDEEFRESCLERTTNQSVLEFFHDRYDRWGRETPALVESSLNKVSAFTLNPKLKAMLGNEKNYLQFKEIMDNGKVLLVSLGRVDTETNRLLGNLVTTGLERQMRNRGNRRLWNLTIDEFANYVANDGSAKTLATVFSEGRKFGLGLTVAHQDITQLSDRVLGAISNVCTKVFFGIGRHDAEYWGKAVGSVDAEAIKRMPMSYGQYELFSPFIEQWEHWIQRLRFQSPRHMSVVVRGGAIRDLKTISLPGIGAGTLRP